MDLRLDSQLALRHGLEQFLDMITYGSAYCGSSLKVAPTKTTVVRTAIHAPTNDAKCSCQKGPQRSNTYYTSARYVIHGHHIV